MKMKFIGLVGLIGGSFACIAHSQTTENYGDATGEVVVGDHPHLDISSVDVTVDAAETNITFKITVTGNPDETDWGKYMIGIRNGGGGAVLGNGWGRPINFSTGMTHWIACWANGNPPKGGGEVYRFQSGVWNKTHTTYDGAVPLSLPVIDSSSFSFTVPVATLNLVPGQTFTFDIYSSGGGDGDGAVDALSTSSPSINDWGNTFTTTAPLSFTMPGVFTGLDPDEDEDLDGYLNGEEVDGTSALGYPSDPFIPNYTNMNVAGSFNAWSATDTATNMAQGNTASLVEQYEWTLDYRFDTAAQPISYKFTTGGSFDINWGRAALAGAVQRDGQDITGFVGAAGIYRFFFNQGGLSHTFERVTFSDYATFRAAYGLVGTDESQTADANPGDGMTDHQNFLAGTNPLVNDTDGDGIIDGSDSQPLVQLRDITFRVNMSIQTALENHVVGDDVKLLVFTGAMINYENPGGGGGYLMSGPDLNGVYTVQLLDVPGFQGQEFGRYKFFNNTAGAPNFGYEDIFDREVNLEAPEVEQIVATVFFSNNANAPDSYAAWAAANVNGQGGSEDFDADGVPNGVEFFMGETGSGFTPGPGMNGSVISWTKGANYPGVYGTDYMVQTSGTLSGWEDVLVSDPLLNDGSPLQYTMPEGEGEIFVRLKVVTSQ